jgi:3-deoxy-D-manno-octulosonic-acid transferase
MIKPGAVFFIKYEFWYFYLKHLESSCIPVYLISGIFRKDQIFFCWYGSWFRKKLSFFTHFFVQDASSSAMLKSIGLQNVSVAGDTRFDRVTTIAAAFSSNSISEAFSAGYFCIVAGSTWPADEEWLIRYINNAPLPVRFILAPHEIDQTHIHWLTVMIRKAYILYSSSTPENVTDKQVLIVDNIGLLSSLYRYAKLAYVGGGFGNGIHNILEAAVYGIPVIFGPNYHKFIEARELIECGGAFSVSSGAQLGNMFNSLVSNTGNREQASRAAGNFIKNNTGATNHIVRHVLQTFN